MEEVVLIKWNTVIKKEKNIVSLILQYQLKEILKQNVVSNLNSKYFVKE